MIKKTPWEDFLDFEIKYQMFDFCDENGFPVWDIVRCYVYSKVTAFEAPVSNSLVDVKNRIVTLIRNIPLLLKWLCSTHKDYFFFLTSRNTIEGKIIDQIAASALLELGIKNCYLVESYADPNDPRLAYSQKPSPSVADLFRYFVYKKYDFSTIIDIVAKKYPHVNLDEKVMTFMYRRFIGQYKFYYIFFKRRHFKKVFLVQNNYQKGMFLAARQLGVPTIEFQHGIVNKAHMAYSYPTGYEGLEDRIIVADRILSFAPFWFHDVYNPVSSFLPVGNDYLAPKISRDHIDKKSFVVVSANVFGRPLKDLVGNVMDDSRAVDYKFYFKLHPNQFGQFDEYKNIFKDYPNVEVISNQRSMQDLMGIVESMIVITSTAVYEALYAGVKVFVYKRLSYEVHLDVAQQKGVYFVDNAKELVDSYEASRNLEMTPDRHYFSKFDKQAFLDAIKN